MYRHQTMRALTSKFDKPAWLLGLCLLISPLALPALAQSEVTEQAEQTEQVEDEQKTLDEIVVEGQTFEKAQPLPKGEVILSPELVRRVNGESGRSAIHAYYEFVFDPVTVNDRGEIFLDPDPRRKRETLRPQMRQKRPRTGSHIKVIPPSFYKLTLEEGFYALSQIRYRAQTRITVIEDPTQFAQNDFEVEESLDVITYCLAKGTLIFDVEADTKATYGKLIARGLFRDKNKWPQHFPIVATDAPATRPADGYLFAKDPNPVAWGVGRFDPEGGLCPQTAERFVTSGWPISENWAW